jgi:hypothetical protein
VETQEQDWGKHQDTKRVKMASQIAVARFKRARQAVKLVRATAKEAVKKREGQP